MRGVSNAEVFLSKKHGACINSPPTSVTITYIFVLTLQLNKSYISLILTGHLALIIFIMDV